MTKIEKLTKEQEKQLEVIKNKHLDLFFTYKELNYEKVKSFFTWLYKISSLKKPQVIIVDSPYQAQIVANILKYDINNLFEKTENEINNELSEKLKTSKTIKEYFSFSYYGSYYDIIWLSFYKFMETICKIDNKLYNKYSEILDLGVYDTIQLERFCIVCKLPKIIKRKMLRLHSNNSPAIEFVDGYKLYFHNGVCVPEKLIMTPDLITKEDILKESNAETRRCYMEILGATTYYNIISDNKGLTLLDEDMDNQGFPMKLYETTFVDKIATSKVQFLEVIDPSTGRMYNIYPPSQKCKNVWEAKANTFNDEKLFVRHGDVGLINLNKSTDNPLIET